MRITNDPTFNPHPVAGEQPHLFHGDARPDATSLFTDKGQGTVYICHPNAYQTEFWRKVKNDGTANDYICKEGYIAQDVSFDDFTDGGSTTGTLVLSGTLPAGSYVTGTYLLDVTGWATVSTLTIQVGDGSDADRYSTGTPSIATAATYLSLGAVSGTNPNATAVSTITITLTEDSDFGDITAGSFTIVIPYTM